MGMKQAGRGLEVRFLEQMDFAGEIFPALFTCYS